MSSDNGKKNWEATKPFVRVKARFRNHFEFLRDILTSAQSRRT